MEEGARDANDRTQAARELRLMRQTLSTLKENTMWTAFGAVSGWVAIVIALVVILS